MSSKPKLADPTLVALDFVGIETTAAHLFDLVTALAVSLVAFEDALVTANQSLTTDLTAWLSILVAAVA